MTNDKKIMFFKTVGKTDPVFSEALQDLSTSLWFLAKSKVWVTSEITHKVKLWKLVDQKVKYTLTEQLEAHLHHDVVTGMAEVPTIN